MSDLTTRLTEAAGVAIAEIGPSIERDARRVRMLTLEVELDTKGNVSGAVAWIEHRVNLARLLGDRGPR